MSVILCDGLFETIDHKEYFYRNRVTIEIYSERLKGIDYVSPDNWLTIKDGKVFIKKEYFSNGASPKWRAWGIRWGTPDGAEGRALVAFFVHDALYQFLNDIGISRKTADLVLYDELKKVKDFKLDFVYYGAVRAAGWYFI